MLIGPRVAMGARKRHHESPLWLAGLEARPEGGALPRTHSLPPRALPPTAIQGPGAWPQTCSKIGAGSRSGERPGGGNRQTSPNQQGLADGAFSSPKGAGCRDVNLPSCKPAQVLRLRGQPQLHPGSSRPANLERSGFLLVLGFCLL